MAKRRRITFKTKDGKNTFLKPERLTFNSWSRDKIEKNKKICTSRTRIWNDDRVTHIVQMPLKIVKEYLFACEGAESPEEFEKVWRSIFRGKFDPEKSVCVHFGDFK